MAFKQNKSIKVGIEHESTRNKNKRLFNKIKLTS